MPPAAQANTSQSIDGLPPLEPNTKNQHYVWKHYLNAWAAEGTFCCYWHADNRLLATQPKRVASQTYFYEAQELTDGDLEFLDLVLGQATDAPLREINKNFIQLTQLPFRIRRLLETSTMPEALRTELEKHLLWAERNSGERFHTSIENEAQDILDKLRNGDATFWDDEEDCINFSYFLSVQYFRTANMQARLGSISATIPGHDPSRTAAVINYMAATNMGASLFREQRAFRIRFLRNRTSVPFITGDQPVLNMLDPTATEDVEIYYPLSPSMALVLTKDMTRFPDGERLATMVEVERYNHAIFSRSNDQVYSNSEAYLRDLVTIDKDL